jgi:uncharacterized protein YkwD
MLAPTVTGVPRNSLARTAAITAFVVALGVGAFAAQDLRESDSAVNCRGTALGYRGRITGPRIPSSHPLLEARIRRLVNEFRVENHRPPLVASPRLGYLARWWARDEHARGFQTHERRGASFVARFARYSPSLCVAENLAQGYVTAPTVVAAWKRSPDHRHVLLLPWINRIGVGVWGLYTVADFSS